MHRPPLPIDLVRPCDPAPVGDCVPWHLFAPEVPWPVPPDAVLRADRPEPLCVDRTAAFYAALDVVWDLEQRRRHRVGGLFVVGWLAFLMLTLALARWLS